MIEREIAGKKRYFEFGTLNFKLISELTGVSNVKNVFVRLSETDLPFMVTVLYTCAVHGCKRQKEKPDFSHDDVYDWVDEIGIQEMELVLTDLIKSYTIKNQKAPETGLEKTTNQ